jgi:hypothetical protein
MDDPDPAWQVIDTLGSLCNYHFEVDGSDWDVGGCSQYIGQERGFGMFHDDPNNPGYETEAIGSSAIILIMSICIPNKFKE